MQTSNIKAETTGYDAKYDIIKFVLSLFVLAIHTVVYPFALYPWLRIAVPLFFMMSSYFCFSKLKSEPADRHGKVLKKFALRNIKLYVSWFILLLPFTLYLRRSEYFSQGIWQGIESFIKGLFFGSTFVASWFITATIFGVLIIYYLSKWFKKKWIILSISAFIFGLVTLQSSYVSCIQETALLSAIHVASRGLGGFVCSFPAAILWIFIGKCFAEAKSKGLPLWLLAVVLTLSCVGLYAEWRFVISLDGSYNNDSYFMLLPVCCALFAIIQRIPAIHWKPSAYLKHASTIIYVSHGSFIPFCSFFLKKVLGFTTPVLDFCLTLICTLTLTVCIEFIGRKYSGKKLGKYIKWLC